MRRARHQSAAEYFWCPTRSKDTGSGDGRPDAPVGTWTHWVAWNLPIHTTEINAGSLLPNGSVEGITSFGKPGYGGPCPPTGEHRYFFKLFALDTSLDLESTTNVEVLRAAMDGHVVDQAELVGLYKRPE